MKLHIIAKISVVLNILLIVFLVYHSGIFKKNKLYDYVSFNDTISKSSGSSNYTDIHLTEIEKDIISLSKEKKIYELDRTQDKYDEIKNRLSRDIYLKLVDISTKEFYESQLKSNLDRLSAMKVYILTEFKKPIDYQTIHKMDSLGFAIPSTKSLNESFGDSVALFYGKYANLKRLKGYLALKKSYLITKYTATGFYKLSIQTDIDQKDFDLTIQLPFDIYGRELIKRSPSFNGLGRIKNKNEFDDRIELTMDIKKKHNYVFFCSLRYIIDMENILTHHVRVSGDLTLDSYKSKTSMIKDYSTFTNYGGKIIISDYVNQIVNEVNLGTNTLASIWATIYNRLNKEIKYDYRKRSLFFEGNLAYTNIADMYMNVAELSSSKVGACPERSSLETAILRKLGIAARTTTRLFHMYTEVYLPDIGWSSTSALLNEIPLCRSKTEDQSYFVDWSPNIAVRIKWEGGLYPVILY